MTIAAFRSVALFVWTRHRFVIVSAAVLYAAALVAYEPLWTREHEAYIELIGAFLRAAPFFLSLILFTSAVSIATTDLATRESWFPRQLLTLPLSASQLALPFAAYLVGLYALLWTAAVWISDARVIYAGPLDLPKEALPYQFWAPFLHLTLLVWAQALIWMPFRARWARVALLFGLLAAYLALLIMTTEGTVPGAVVIALALASIPAAYLAGVRGVARARAGDVPRAAPALRPPRVRDARRPARFATALEAQYWFETHAQRGRAGFVTVFVVPLVLLLVVLGLLAAPLGQDQAPAGGLALRGAGLLLWVFAIAGLASGPAFAAFRADLRWQADDAFRMPSFFAALPLPTGEFAWIKLKTAARRMLRVGAVVLAFAVGILALTGILDAWQAPLALLTDRFGAFEVRMVLALAAAAFLLTVAAATANLVWVGLIGRRWHLANALLVVAVVAVVLVSTSLGRTAQTIGAVLPALLTVLAAAKLGALAWLVRAVDRRALYDRPRIARICACWLGAVIVGSLLVLRYVPAGTVTPLTAAASLVAGLPILGLFAAPLALHSNRCR